MFQTCGDVLRVTTVKRESDGWMFRAQSLCGTGNLTHGRGLSGADGQGSGQGLTCGEFGACPLG